MFSSNLSTNPSSLKSSNCASVKTEEDILQLVKQVQQYTEKVLSQEKKKTSSTFHCIFSCFRKRAFDEIHYIEKCKKKLDDFLSFKYCNCGGGNRKEGLFQHRASVLKEKSMAGEFTTYESDSSIRDNRLVNKEKELIPHHINYKKNVDIMNLLKKIREINGYQYYKMEKSSKAYKVFDHIHKTLNAI